MRAKLRAIEEGLRHRVHRPIPAGDAKAVERGRSEGRVDRRLSWNAGDVGVTHPYNRDEERCRERTKKLGLKTVGKRDVTIAQ
jgi:hypothetical protein